MKLLPIVQKMLWMPFSFVLVYALLVSSLTASLYDVIDTDIPVQKMVMGRAGLSRDPVNQPSAAVQVDYEKKEPPSVSAKSLDPMVASKTFPAALVYDFAAKVARDTLSYSAKRLPRDKKLVSEYYAASAWPKMHHALFVDTDAPLQSVGKGQADSLAVLLDMPTFSHTEQWDAFSIWVFKVPVLVTVYQQPPKKHVFEALLAISVEDGLSPRFVVQKALLQKRMVPQGN